MSICHPLSPLSLSSLSDNTMLRNGSKLTCCSSVGARDVVGSHTTASAREARSPRSEAGHSNRCAHVKDEVHPALH